MITVYHNPRCSKSREACALIETACAASGEDVTVIEYLKMPPTLAELKSLHTRLGVPVRDMLREGETEYAELGLSNASLSDNDLLAAIVAHPKLLQRPIVVRGEHAVIARPPERVKEVL